jgi:ribosomal protein S18 acetylase RimI-like enzyme
MWLRDVRSDTELQAVRRIRNTCRAFMTRNTEEISEEQQRDWWAKRDPTIRLVLFGVGADEVGYGLLRTEHERPWLSGGLSPEWRGRGLGEQLFRALSCAAGMPCMLEVLESNARAHKIYERIGFRELRRDGRVITMELLELT